MPRQKITSIGTCPDCGRENIELNSNSICKKCAQRKANMIHRRGIYIPYIKLSEKEKQKVNSMIDAQKLNHNDSLHQSTSSITTENTITDVTAKPKKSSISKSKQPSNDNNKFISLLRDHGCAIPEKNLNDVLNILNSTNQLKDLIITITENDNQQALLDLDQALNALERKLQHVWEFNGFKKEDDENFKNFLIWRRSLKGAMFFWKKLYESNALLELQKAWNAYSQNPSEKILIANDRINSTLKRYQITTESISTILNTRKPFTRVFYATNKDDAYRLFVQWMSDRQLHENKAKTIITEL